MATVSIILRTDKEKKDGTMPLNFLIIKDRKKTKLATGIFIESRHWDEKKSRIKPQGTNSARNNIFLYDRLAELQGTIVSEETNTKSLSAKQLKRKIHGLKPLDFLEFADLTNKNYLKTGQVSSYNKNTYILNKIKEYIGENASLDFQDVTLEFLTKYESYLRITKSNSTNTIHKDFRYIRKLFNDAYREERIEHHHIPFNKYKLKLEKTTRDYLSEDELQKIDDLKLNDGTKMDLHKDMFVFACYTGGLRVSDMLLIKWNTFDGTHINFTIQKTNSQISIKLPSRALEILNKYKPIKIDRNAFVFPMLDNMLNLKDPEASLKAVSSATAYINKNLKTIADKAGVDKHISFHVSRHTWATRALKKGVSIDKVSKIMGHAQIRETQIYAKIVNEELDKAMDVFN